LSDRQLNLADIIRLAVAAARAAAGEFTGLAVEGARHSRKIITLVITLVIGVLLLFTTLVSSVSKHIPGFEVLYDIYRTIRPPSYAIPYTNTGISAEGMENTMVFPIPSGFGYTMLETHERNVEIQLSQGTPIVAIESGYILPVDETSLIIESLDGIRKYQYSGMQCQVNSSTGYDVLDTGIPVQAGEIAAYPLSAGQDNTGQPINRPVEIRMWLKERNRWISTSPYQLLRLLSVSSRTPLSGSRQEGE